MAENFRRAGALRERMEMRAAGDGDDGWGVPIPGAGPIETKFTISAGMRPLRGTEAVQAARLGGQQPYVVTVRKTSQTDQITAAWQMRDARNQSRTFAITSPPADPDGSNQWLEFLAVEGSANADTSSGAGSSQEEAPPVP